MKKESPRGAVLGSAATQQEQEVGVAAPWAQERAAAGQLGAVALALEMTAAQQGLEKIVAWALQRAAAVWAKRIAAAKKTQKTAAALGLVTAVAQKSTTTHELEPAAAPM